MHIEINSFPGLVLFLCISSLIFMALPLAIIWRVRSTFKGLRHGESSWKSDPTYRFITNPDNKPSISIFTRAIVLVVVVLFLGLFGLIAYLAINTGSNSWIILIIFLIPLLAGIVFTPIALIFAQKQLNKSQTKDE